MKLRLTILFLAMTGLFLLLSVGGFFSPDTTPTAALDVPYSNIHPEDYVGPEKCAECHAEHYRKWQTHPHSKMNLNPSDETILGDFSNHRVKYGNGEAVFEKRDDEFFMSLFEEGQLTHEYRITKTVGSQHTQMYIGVQTIGPEPSDHQAYRIEGKLPFGYWIRHNLWTPVSYFDSAYEAEPNDGHEKMELLNLVQKETKWELNCLYCHNTYAYQHRLYFSNVLGFPREDFRFPEGAESIQEWGPLTPEKLVTLGVSCESCHYGGREHVENGRESRFYPSSPKLQSTSISPETPTTNANLINSICLQCHCANVILYPNGAATWNSREALDLQSGACQQQIKCTDCHDPHPAGKHGGLFSEQKITWKCLECHTQLQDDVSRQTHSRHTLDSVSCVDCHMPRIVQGLDQVVRTHHIHSPSDESMLQRAGPNACNICHLDKPIDWTLNHLNEGWGLNIKSDSNWSDEYGENLALPVGEVWLNHSQPVARLIASDAYSRSAANSETTSDLLKLLKDPYAVNRMFGLLAIERILGRKLTAAEYVPTASHLELEKMVEILKETLGGVDLNLD